MKQTLFIIAKSPLGELIIGLAFGKLSKLLPVDRIKETNKILAFKHPRPYWKEHILIVPKKAIKSLTEVTDADLEYISEAFQVAREIIKERGWKNSDFTIVTNGGKRQEVPQIHFHLGSGPTLNI